MFERRARRRLWNQLVDAGMNQVAATEVASAAYPSRTDHPMREPALAPEKVQEVAARAAEAEVIDGEALFEDVFGVSWDDYSADHLG